MADSYIVNFYDLFNKPLEIQDDVQLKVNKIIIPLIQRDYAQGRKTYEINRIRSKFLKSLHDSITSDRPINLDFIYGDIDEAGNLTPLDGQQRLTTLFLLHWYAAKKEKVNDEEYSFLFNFSYETRYSSRDFCTELVKFIPSFSYDSELSQEIVDQSWFPLDWLNDQTISSMLVMIDDIDKTFRNVENLWYKLVSKNSITFYFLPIKNLGLSDELYIKMNSRGKPLTRFEHFKAELESQLLLLDKEIAKRISKKIDQQWTDMLWRYRDNDQIDNLFLNIFKFTCDIICYEEGGSTSNRSYDEFSLIEDYFESTNPKILRHIESLESILDGFASFNGDTLNNLFDKFIAKSHTDRKTKVYNITELDLFRDCLYNYMDPSSLRRSRAFSLSKFLLLYTFTVYVINKNSINELDFINRLRVVYNLIQNSDDEILSDSESRQGGNRIPAAVEQINSIIKKGIILDNIKINFNDEQLNEEKQKQGWRSLHQNYISSLEKLEDSEYVRGQMSFLNFDHPENFTRFLDLFKCDLDKINCALLVYGDYSRMENQYRHCLGTRASQYAVSVWRAILHKSRASGFNTLKSILDSFLQTNATINNDVLDNIINEFLTKCETNATYDWRYYFIKYPSFRPDRYGKYWIESKYNFNALYAEKQLSEHSYQPFLYEVCKSKLDSDDYGRRCVSGNNYLYCENSGFYLRNSSGAIVSSLVIVQDENGIDKEDRILKYKNNPLMI
ncbi:MAG: DUF262 domain-containing protein [Bacilli bacterium]|nr:DUF262 domain-containing protein [Bacilli bacterium]